MISARPFFRNPAAVGLMIAATCLPIAAEDARLDEAIRLYDAGSYAEAKPLLEQLVAAGNADGITHYRLFYCQRTTGDPAQRQTLERARVLLEEEVLDATGFEAAFYLSNTYANLGLTGEVPGLAATVTTRFEAGEIAEPTTAVEQFRLGKLYADQNRPIDATPWFEKAIDGFEASGDTGFGPYLVWGARWLGNRASEEERYEAAVKQFGRVSASGNATLEDLDKLGVAGLMVGEYRTATKAWNQAIRLNPGDADRYRYAAALAELCRRTGEPPTSPDGERRWDELSAEELNQMLTENATIVREVKTEVQAIEKPTREQILEFNARMEAVRPLFLGAGVESVRRGINIREAAFFGGYAPLIFHAREWKLKLPPPVRRKGAGRKGAPRPKKQD